MSILAADPGLSGALAHYDLNRGLLSVLPMPVYRVDEGRKLFDEPAILAAFQTFRLLGAEVFVVEKVNGIPGQSAPAAFNFGYGYGLLIATARTLGYRLERHQPALWKRAARVPADKQAARARASEVFPQHAGLWPNKGDHGKAEAALLAKYGAEVVG